MLNRDKVTFFFRHTDACCKKELKKPLAETSDCTLKIKVNLSADNG